MKLSQIARLADVTTGAVTHYFDDKDDILLAALEMVCERLFGKIQTCAFGNRNHDDDDDDDDDADHDDRGGGDHDDDQPLVRMFDVLPITLQSMAEWKVWLAFWGRAACVPRLASVHRDYYRRFEDGMLAELGGDPGRARLRAAAIIAAIDGVGTRATLEPDDWPPERQRQLLAMLITPLLAYVDPPPQRVWPLQLA